MQKPACLFLILCIVSGLHSQPIQGRLIIDDWLPPGLMSGPEITNLRLEWNMLESQQGPEQHLRLQWYLGDKYKSKDQVFDLELLGPQKNSLHMVNIAVFAEVLVEGKSRGYVILPMEQLPAEGGRWSGPEKVITSWEEWLLNKKPEQGEWDFHTAETAKAVWNAGFTLANPGILWIEFGGVHISTKYLKDEQEAKSYDHLLQEGLGEMKDGKYNRAIVLFDQILLQVPGDSLALEKKKESQAKMLIASGNYSFQNQVYETALEKYKAAKRIWPDSPDLDARISLTSEKLYRTEEVQAKIQELQARLPLAIRRAKNKQDSLIQIAAKAYAIESENCAMDWSAFYQCQEKALLDAQLNIDHISKEIVFARIKQQAMFESPCFKPQCLPVNSQNMLWLNARSYLEAANRKWQRYTFHQHVAFQRAADSLSQMAIEADPTLAEAYVFRTNFTNSYPEKYLLLSHAADLRPSQSEWVEQMHAMRDSVISLSVEYIERGDLEALSPLIDQKAIHPNFSYRRNSLLEHAVKSDQVSVLDYFLSQQPELLSDSLLSPVQSLLMTAAQFDAKESAKYLLQKGGDAHYKNIYGESPVSIATSAHASNVLAVLLLAHRSQLARVQGPDLRNEVQYAVEEGNPDLLETFLAAGASVESPDSSQESLLMKAIKQNKVEIANLLIKHKASPNWKSLDGDTPLKLSIESRFESITRELLQRGASPDFDSLSNQTDKAFLAKQLIELAFIEQDTSWINKTLRSYPLSSLLQNETGEMYLRKSIMDGMEMYAIALADSIPKIDSVFAEGPLLIQATRAKLPELSKSLLAKGANPDIFHVNGRSPLWYAAHNGDTAIIRILLGAKARQRRDDQGNSPLHIALENGHLQAASLLAQDPNSQPLPNGRGNYPIHIAIRQGYIDLVHIMLEQGANIDLAGESQLTLLHVAAEAKQYIIARGLVEDGANLRLKDSFNRTPGDIAKKLGDKPMTDLLYKRKKLKDLLPQKAHF